MPEICYVPKTFRGASLQTIHRARTICEEYAAEGFDLTLRQLYYQFVSRDWIANKDTEYKRLGSIINDARLAGQLDWNFIVDRTRNLRGNSHWDTPAEVLQSAARGYATDKWRSQDTRIEVWIEKDALVGVLESCCPGLDVDYFSCRGYTSQSEVWGAAQRIGHYIDEGQQVVVLHLGDHDPSGIDMTRDIRERLSMFIAQDLGHADAYAGYEPWEYQEEIGGSLIIERIALNWPQVEEHQPPPNPAKLSDSRAERYIEKYGRYSWELDALEPRLLVALIEESVHRYRDVEKWNDAVDVEEADRKGLTATAERWPEVKAFLA